MNGDLTRVVILLGSNINPERCIPRAIDQLEKSIKIDAISTTWENPPVGPPAPVFYNTAVRGLTSLMKADLVTQILKPIEARLGRVRTSDKYAPRTIDLDIILFGDELIEPRLWSDAFIAVPVSEVLPDYQKVETKQSLTETARRFLDKGGFIPHPELLDRIKTQADKDSTCWP
jgi:2-amino-4-hydroxy-6-hydroxymethyldihydropteridine diphosphokinase